MEISYADNVIFLARVERGLQLLNERFRRYIKKNGLELNDTKSKIMIFRKARGRIKKLEFVWNKKEIEFA